MLPRHARPVKLLARLARPLKTSALHAAKHIICKVKPAPKTAEPMPWVTILKECAWLVYLLALLARQLLRLVLPALTPNFSITTNV